MLSEIEIIFWDALSLAEWFILGAISQVVLVDFHIFKKKIFFNQEMFD